ncbi:uncharacterized protein LOC117175165 [Belonocnema kinseyi]|uniref:uncharacterized protein LOC117175165 n=1 Tax=Belonocnema kinseyi TaxID=2817044 RepID=UPI00143DCC24|nr:uncharacterized protein LOC117175165 [Belonocnema kinseyi]
MKLPLSALCAISAFLVIKADEEVPLPPEFRRCNRNAADFSLCARQAIEEAWPTLVKGIPELGIPQLDPFVVNSLEQEFHSGVLRGKMIVKNARVYGAAGHKFKSVKLHLNGDRFNMEMDVTVPKILTEGDYMGDGYISAFKIGGKGQFNVTMEGIKTYFNIEGRVENDRWVVEHFKVFPEISNMHIWFSDLFNGNKDLNKAALIFCNEYWPVLYRGMLPYISPYMDNYMTDFANRVFSKISFSNMFPSEK